MRSVPPTGPASSARSRDASPAPVDAAPRRENADDAGSTPAEADAWPRYRDNLARHLIGIARDLQNRLMTHLADERGYADLRPSLGPLLSLIRIEARTSSALASALAISPQACSQLVKYAQAAGYVEQRAHAADRRSKLVDLTARGSRLVEDAARRIREVESEYRRHVGPHAYQGLTKALATLCRGLDLPTLSDPSLSARSSHSAGVLPLLSVQVQQQLMRSTAARGHDGLKMSHGQILPLIGQRGARVHQIARIHRVSRQAISACARDLESLGYLQGQSDPHDRRGVVLALTREGHELIRDSVAALDELDAGFSAILGKRSLAQLEEVARALYLALELDHELCEANDAVRPAASEPRDHATIRPHTPDHRPSPTNLPDTAGSRETPDKVARIAAELRQRLGPRDALRLAALLGGT